MAELQVTNGMRIHCTDEKIGPEEDLRKQHVMHLLVEAQVIVVDKTSPSMTRLLIPRADNPGFQFEETQEHKEGGTLLVPSEWLTSRYFRVISG